MPAGEGTMLFRDLGLISLSFSEQFIIWYSHKCLNYIAKQVGVLFQYSFKKINVLCLFTAPREPFKRPSSEHTVQLPINWIRQSDRSMDPLGVHLFSHSTVKHVYSTMMYLICFSENNSFQQPSKSDAWTGLSCSWIRNWEEKTEHCADYLQIVSIYSKTAVV